MISSFSKEQALQTLPHWMRDNATWGTTDTGRIEEDSLDSTLAVKETRIQDALLMGAQVDERLSRFRLVLDLDHDAVLIPSSTPGHHHLVVDTRMSRTQHDDAIAALARAGVIQYGFAATAQRSPIGATVRPPWVKKGWDRTLVEQAEDFIAETREAVTDALDHLPITDEALEGAAEAAVAVVRRSLMRTGGDDK